MNIQGISPVITAPLQAHNVSSNASTNSSSSTSSTSGSSTSGSSQLSSTNLESTFLNLLATELQNQDPTQPVDPTEMVGQLVSLNQLDQLISINQTLSGLGSSTSGTSGSTASAAAAGIGASSGSQSLLGAPNPGSFSNNTPPSSVLPTQTPSISALMNQFQPVNAAAAGANALMNLYGSFTAPAQSQQLSHTGGR